MLSFLFVSGLVNDKAFGIQAVESDSPVPVVALINKKKGKANKPSIALQRTATKRSLEGASAIVLKQVRADLFLPLTL